jgi:hypothetical protein
MLAMLWPRVAFAAVLFAGLGVVGWGIIRSQYSARLAQREKAVMLAKHLETATAARAERFEAPAPRGRGLAEKEAELLARAPAAPTPTLADKLESSEEKMPAEKPATAGRPLKRLNDEMAAGNAGRLEEDKASRAARDQEVRLRRESLAGIGKQTELSGKGPESLPTSLAPFQPAPTPDRAESQIVAAAPMVDAVKLKADFKPTTMTPGGTQVTRTDLDGVAPGTVLDLNSLRPTDSYGFVVPTTSFGTVTNSRSMNWALTAAPASGSLIRYSGGAGSQFGLATNAVGAVNGIAAPDLFYAGASPTPLAVTAPSILRQSDTKGPSPASSLPTKPGQTADQERLVLLAEQTAPAPEGAFPKKQGQAGVAGEVLNRPTPTTPRPRAQVPEQPTADPAQVAAINSRQYQFRSQGARQAPFAAQRRVVPALLNSFQFEQNGDRVRIVDGDNSVYEGQVVTATSATLALGEPLQSTAEKSPPLPNDQRSKDIKQATEMAAGGSLPVSFRASGTNLTAKQLVTIEATLTPANQGTPRPAGQFSETRSRAQGAPAPGVTAKVGPSSVRVQGRARLGTNEMPIDAMGAATQR